VGLGQTNKLSTEIDSHLILTEKSLFNSIKSGDVNTTARTAD
jgi:hypothetical protein